MVWIGAPYLVAGQVEHRNWPIAPM